jgi:hypothetical protein
MDFHLQFPVSPFPRKINYSHSSVFVGSCFAENIAEQMRNSKFKVLENPHGILYDPAGIAKALRRYCSGTVMTGDELFHANDCWNSWEHHSRFSNPDKEECLNAINRHILFAHTALGKAQWLFISFGTAFVYEKDGCSVANCHKVPQKQFTKRFLEIPEIVNEYQQLFARLCKWNSDLKIVLSVSPVRYVRDGVEQNNRSKARLLEAVHQLKSNDVFYFPAYELVIDDLRDYRFYGADLVHPNDQAINYVYEKFKAAAFDSPAISLSEKIGELLKAKEHRPFQKGTEAYEKFRSTYHRRCLDLKKEFPFLELEDEILHFS